MVGIIYKVFYPIEIQINTFQLFWLIHLISSVISITIANAENTINLEKTEAVLLELPCCMAAGCSPVISTYYIHTNFNVGANLPVMT